MHQDCSRFRVLYQGQERAQVDWDLIGRHNMLNALAAIAAATVVEVTIDMAAAALAAFKNVKRRMEIRGTARVITVYDDFAHHPTEISASVEALRARVGSQRVIAVLDPRSNTMRMGVHRESLAASLDGADQVLLFQLPELQWELKLVGDALNGKARVFKSVDAILSALVADLHQDDHVLIMSNGGFENIHTRLLEQLRS